MRSSFFGSVLAAVLASAANAAAGAYTAPTNYVLHCQGCHGADGIGTTPDEVPPLRDSVGYFLRIPKGRDYLAQVPGAAQAPISDAELALLLNYMIERFSSAQAPTEYAPYTPEEVARVRRLRPDIVALRAQLVAEIRTQFGVELWSDSYAR